MRLSRRKFLISSAAVGVAAAIPLSEIAPFVEKIAPSALRSGVFRVTCMNFDTECVEVHMSLIDNPTFTSKMNVARNTVHFEVGDQVRVEVLVPQTDLDHNFDTSAFYYLDDETYHLPGEVPDV